MQRLALALGALAAAALAASAPAAASEALAKSKNCMACHTVAARLVGPAWLEVAARYSAADAGRLANSIRRGSKGAWGAVPMPSNSRVSEEDARKLAAWIVNLGK